MKRTWRKKILPVLSGMVTVMVLAFTVPAVGRAYVQTTGVITTDAAKVRKEPSTESDMLATVLKGSAVIVTDEVTDSAGMVWYKVSYMGGSGYIRSDLMSKMTAAGTTLTTTTQTGNANATTTAKPSATQVTAIAETKAYVNYKSVMVRQSASKQAEIVGSAVQNTPMTITGEAKAADGKKWYQVKYMNQNNREIVGFVRSDLLTVGDPPAPPVTDAPAETPAEAPAETSSETPAEQPEGGENAGGRIRKAVKAQRKVRKAVKGRKSRNLHRSRNRNRNRFPRKRQRRITRWCWKPMRKAPGYGIFMTILTIINSLWKISVNGQRKGKPRYLWRNSCPFSRLH